LGKRKRSMLNIDNGEIKRRWRALTFIGCFKAFQAFEYSALEYHYNNSGKKAN
jgi:hypothetical protein